MPKRIALPHTDLNRAWHKAYGVAARRIERAIRYDLDPTLVPIILNFCHSRPGKILETIEWARPPAKLTWIEFAEHPRTEFRESVGLALANDHNPVPQRTGLLIEAIDDKSTRYLVQVFWRHADGTIHISAAAILIDLVDRVAFAPSEEDIARGFLRKGTLWSLHKPSPTNIADVQALHEHIALIPAPLYADVFDIVRRQGDHHVDTLVEMGRSDTDPEVLFTIGTLLMMNTVNGLELQSHDASRLNRQRVKAGNPPLLAYSTARFRLSRPEKAALRQASADGGTKAWHHCIGHPKRRKATNGSIRLIWWREHWRGDPSRLRLKTRPIRISP